jgi:hypothetical protein
MTPLSDHEDLRNALPHAKLTILDNGHNAWDESPTVYAQSVTFWVRRDYRYV